MPFFKSEPEVLIAPLILGYHHAIWHCLSDYTCIFLLLYSLLSLFLPLNWQLLWRIHLCWKYKCSIDNNTCIYNNNHSKSNLLLHLYIILAFNKESKFSLDPSHLWAETTARILAISDWTIPELMDLGYEPLYPFSVTLAAPLKRQGQFGIVSNILHF